MCGGNSVGGLGGLGQWQSVALGLIGKWEGRAGDSLTGPPHPTHLLLAAISRVVLAFGRVVAKELLFQYMKHVERGNVMRNAQVRSNGNEEIKINK